MTSNNNCVLCKTNTTYEDKREQKNRKHAMITQNNTHTEINKNKNRNTETETERNKKN